jgi:hypothetical protein
MGSIQQVESLLILVIATGGNQLGGFAFGVVFVVVIVKFIVEADIIARLSFSRLNIFVFLAGMTFERTLGLEDVVVIV